MENQHRGIIGSSLLVLFCALMSAEVTRSRPADPPFFNRPQKLQTSLIRSPPTTPPPLPPSLLPPVLQPLSKCHLANKTPVHTEPEQNTASSIHTATVKHSNKCCHLFKNPAVSFLFFLLSGAKNFSPQIKEGIIANMAEIPTLIPILCACVCDSCMRAMKKPIVVVPVRLISVYTTMSVVLWSPLVRLFVGLYCEPSGNAEGTVEIRVCVRVPCMSVLSETHISVPVCLVAVSSSSHPRAQRLGCLLIYGGEAPRLQDRVALLPSVPARGPEESSSAWLFTLCPLIT